MARRPTLLDRMMARVGFAHARRVYRKFRAAAEQATAIQEKALLAKVRRNADSAFGRDYGFKQIRSAKEFTRRVPVLRYEDHRPYIERVMAGELDAMFGRGQRVLMFAMTSGSTDQPKYIPVTSEFLSEYRRGWNAFGIKSLLDHPAAILRGIVQVTSRMDESHTTAGIPCGAITGLMAATQKRVVRKYYLTPRCLAEIDDAAAKYYTIMRLSVPADAAFLITASPATQLKLARAADTHREQLIRDVHDGTLWPDLPVPEHVRRELRPRIMPSRETARRLESIVSDHGRLLPRHYWNLAFLANWTGGTMGLYLRDFPEYFGDVPVRDIGLLASEGRISIPIEDGTAAGILDVTSHFFEFIPRDEMDSTQGGAVPALRSHELEVGREYFVLLTTSSGLYRYDLRDLVRVVGYAGQAPVIEFLNKGERVSSVAGEKLTEHQVILAMERVSRNSGVRAENFVLAPVWGQPPYYRIHIEAACMRALARGVDLAAAMDAELSAVNVEYDARRRSDRLGPASLNVLPDGFLVSRDARLAERHRRGNEQYKHQYLCSKPGDDADLSVGASGVASSVPGR